MWTLNLFISSIFDLLFAPFASFHNFWAIAFISAVTGVVMIIIYKYTSNQEGIKRSKDRIKAYFLEIRLLGDDWRSMLASQKNIFLANLNYMKYALIPLCFIIVPVILIMVQLNSRYGYEPLKVGEHAVVSVKFDYSKDARYAEIDLSVPEGIVVDAPAMTIKETNEINWRIKPERQGIYDLVFDMGGEKFTKKIVASRKITRFSKETKKATLKDAFLNPVGEPLPAMGSIQSISITYKPALIEIFSYKVHWIIVFFVLSLIAGFSLKGFFGVEV